MLIIEEAVDVKGSGVYGIALLSSQSCSVPKIALKNKVFFLKNKQTKVDSITSVLY